MAASKHAQSVRHGRRPACWRAWALAAALVLLLAPRLGAAAQSHEPLSEEDVIGLLNNDVPPARVATFAKQFGVSFEITGEVEGRLRKAGADDELIQTLKSLAPKPSAPAAPKTQPASPPQPTSPAHASPPPAPAPPVLLIESKPGDAQVYIDDAPVGTTSPEGRLKLPNLSPGVHDVRVSMAGYRDFEQSVDLTSGTLTVAANLRRPVAAGQGFLGANISNLNWKLARMFKAPDPLGALIHSVLAGGPAAQAGLKPGDVVRKFNGVALDNASGLVALVRSSNPGQPVTLQILRLGKPLTVTVSLGAAPASVAQHAGSSPLPQGAPLRGVTVQELTPALRMQWSIPATIEGAEVLAVAPGTPAAKALESGDVVEAINRQRVTDVTDFERTASLAHGDTLLLIERQGAGLYVVVSPK